MPLVDSDDPTVVLTHVVDVLLSESSSTLDPAVALSRATSLLAEVERLQATAALAVADVDARELWALPGGPGSGGTRTWLRSLPGGEAGQLALGRRLSTYASVRGAVLVGQVGVRSAQAVAAALDQVQALGEVAEDQLVGVLVHGVPGLLSVWCGAGRPEDLRSEQDETRTDLAASVIGGCVQDQLASPAARLEPALVLLARALTPAALVDALGTFLDALVPERLDERERKVYESRQLTLRRRADGGWDLRALLTDEVGQRLYDLLHRPAAAGQDATPDPSQDNSPAASGPAGDTSTATHEDPRTDDDLCTDDDPGGDAPASAQVAPAAATAATGALAVGAAAVAETPPTGDPQSAPGWGLPIAPSWADGDLSEAVIDPQIAWPFAFLPSGPPPHPEQGNGHQPDAARDRLPGSDERAPEDGQVGAGVTPLPTGRWRDRDTATVEGPPELTTGQRAHDTLADLIDGSAPSPAAITVSVTLAMLTGVLGALPGQLQTGAGPVGLSPAALRRAGCHSTLAAVLVDAEGRPVGASGGHRNATDRERRALATTWGTCCAVNGCGSHRTVPHHVQPWHLVGRTTLRDLVPLCNAHHHALHDVGRTLRLRNGREITDTGWASTTDVVAA